MTMPTHYPNAPITEAIINLRVGLAANLDRARLKVVGEENGSLYPKREELFDVAGQIAIGSSASSASVQQLPKGWKSTSRDGKQIFQCREDAFVFSRLAPYDRWEPFRDEAARLWKRYREMLNPEAVVRLAVRYINRIDVPGSQVDLKEFLRTSPEISPELPQALEGYFMQLRLPFPAISAKCIVNQTIVPPARNGVVSVVLDLDLFRDADVPQDEESIWNVFETLHVEKNRIFESCITDAARRLFDSCQF